MKTLLPLFSLFIVTKDFFLYFFYLFLFITSILFLSFFSLFYSTEADNRCLRYSITNSLHPSLSFFFSFFLFGIFDFFFFPCSWNGIVHYLSEVMRGHNIWTYISMSKSINFIDKQQWLGFLKNELNKISISSKFDRRTWFVNSNVLKRVENVALIW